MRLSGLPRTSVCATPNSPMWTLGRYRPELAFLFLLMAFIVSFFPKIPTLPTELFGVPESVRVLGYFFATFERTLVSQKTEIQQKA